MGQAVIGGVITSSLLTLVVVPVVYCYLDDLSVWLSRLLGLKTPAADPAATVSTFGKTDRIEP
jgi:HAE1 family hydrophobic/amphiphilic exporter-1